MPRSSRSFRSFISAPALGPPALVNLAIAATILIGLYVDQNGGAWGQWVVSAAAWLMFGALCLRTAPSERTGLIACLLYATLGEVFLSLVWGLYEYRLHNIPLFVPPGHVLLFALGTSLARRLPEGAVWVVFMAAAPVIGVLAFEGTDTLGPGLLGLLFVCLVFGPSKKLYATMFVLALLMELYGTWLGNWTWSRDVAWFHLACANPPLAAGAFYCVLDLLVLATLAMRGRARTRRIPQLDIAGSTADLSRGRSG
jgi:hypothetical protein